MVNDQITLALQQLARRLPEVETARQYYAGDHTATFNGERFDRLFARQLHGLRDNLCGAVVDAVADRLQVTGFGGDERAIEVANDLWLANRMDRQAGELHLEAGRTGDAYLIVWPDNQGIVRMHAQPSAQIEVLYDPEIPGRVLLAIKVWRELDKTIRVNVYTAETVERYVYNGEDGMPTDAKKLRPLAEDPVVANPWGIVPVFHFPANAAIGEHGRSDLADVRPLQDALNKTLADLLVAQEFIALPQRARIGVEANYDPVTGRPVPPAQGPGAVWDIGNEQAAVQQFATPEITQLVNAAEAIRMEIARVSRIPAHLLGLAATTYPSGESLRLAERPMVARILDRQRTFGEVWADALHLALRMDGIDNTTADSVVVTWTEASPITEGERIANAETLRRLGVPLSEVLRYLGYEDAQVDDIMAQAEAEADAARLAAGIMLDRGLGA